MNLDRVLRCPMCGRTDGVKTIWGDESNDDIPYNKCEACGHEW